MKGILWLVILTAVLSMTGILPFESNDVATLVPVETLTVDMDGGQVLLKGKNCQGRGENWKTALTDLRQSGTGTVFLGTAEHVVLSQRAAAVLPDIIRSEALRPAAVICVCPGEPPEPEQAAEYLSAHKGGMTVQKVQAVLLRGEGARFPMLVKTEGGLRLYDAEIG